MQRITATINSPGSLGPFSVPAAGSRSDVQSESVMDDVAYFMAASGSGNPRHMGRNHVNGTSDS